MQAFKILVLFLVFSISHARAIVPVEAYTFDFNIETSRMGPVKEEKLFEAVELLQEVFASPEFKRKILLHRYKGRYQFAHNRGLSNYQIYKRILSGVEKLYPVKNNAMDVVIELYTNNKSIVMGYTNPFTQKIWMNTKYFNRHTPAEVASHLTHEWLHKLGFGHERKKNNNRKYSVPYAIGYIVKEMARELNEDIR